LAWSVVAGKNGCVSFPPVCAYHYHAAGLRVACDLPLTGLIPAKAADGLVDWGSPNGEACCAVAPDPDVTIHRDTLLPCPAAASDPYAELCFDIDGVMRLAIRDGRRICYDPHPGVAPDDLAIYLGGTGLGALMHQRRRVVLHASAVRIGDSAILFCGPSGAGKSTLAAALVDRGHHHIADDFCAIDFAEDGTPMVAPDGRRHKLWDSAIAGLGHSARQGGAVRSGMTKYYVDPRANVAVSCAIAAILLLIPGGPPAIQTLPRVGQVVAIRDNAYRPALVTMLDQHIFYFESAARLARECRIARLIRPLDYAELDRTIDVLVDFLEN
jgi:hypothetical protein